MPHHVEQGQNEERGEIMIEAGTHSPHYGQIQRERQKWLVKKAQELWRHYGDEGVAAEAAAAAAVAAAAAMSKPRRPHESTTTGVKPNQNSQHKKGKGTSEQDQDSLEGRRFVGSSVLFAAIDQHGKGKNGNGGKRKMIDQEAPVRPLALEGGNTSYRDRIQRLEDGVMLWGATYVPAIEAGRRRELIDKWSPPGGTQVIVYFPCVDEQEQE